MKNLPSVTEIISSRYHWRNIRRLRVAVVALISQGTPFCDRRLITLANRIELHGMAISRLQRQFRQRVTLTPIDIESSIVIDSTVAV